MRKKLDITEGIFPMPVLMIATYNEDGSVNVMNAAWGTMQERGTVALNLTESHKALNLETMFLTSSRRVASPPARQKTLTLL